MAAPNKRAKPAGSGRKKGTPNKDKTELLALVRDAVGNNDYHPVVAMALVAHDTSTKRVKDPYTKKYRTQPKVPLELRCRMHQEVARYVAPQLKAIEHRAGDETKGLNFIMGIVENQVVTQPDKLPTNGKGTNGSGNGPAGTNGSGSPRPRPRAGQ